MPGSIHAFDTLERSKKTRNTKSEIRNKSK
jgi:hypothetical protein